MAGCHPSHKTRMSIDASTYDEICEVCGATDQMPGGWGELANPCPGAPRTAQKKPPSPSPSTEDALIARVVTDLLPKNAGLQDPLLLRPKLESALRAIYELGFQHGKSQEEDFWLKQLDKDREGT